MKTFFITVLLVVHRISPAYCQRLALKMLPAIL
jgi:hypothetical protein